MNIAEKVYPQKLSWLYPLHPFVMFALLKMYDMKIPETVDIDTFEEDCIKFRELYHQVAVDMNRQNIQFSFPGGSTIRHFIFWYNAQFWKNMMPHAYFYVAPEGLHEKISDIVLRYDSIFEVKYNDPTPINISNKFPLTSLGKKVLPNLASFKDYTTEN